MTTLIVTNDFPPRIGGIESFVHDLTALLDHDVVVYTSGPSDAEASDRDRGYPVFRDGSLLLPTPRVRIRAVELLAAHRCTRVVFGAAAPLGLLAPALRRAGAERVVALTHGHETWWATVPLTRRLLRRIGDGCDHLTTISDYTRGRIAPALTPAARAALCRLSPPVDTDRFRPAAATPEPDAGVRRCIAVGRFVDQKGLDVLVSAWAHVLSAHPPPGTDRRPRWELVLVGDGPLRRRLERLVRRLGLEATVRFTGPLARAAVVAELQQAHVFALPVRTRLTGLVRAGLHPEGLGLAALEAAACGLPVVVGRSGGAPETVVDGVSGFVVEPDRPRELAARIAMLLADPATARAMGRAGRAHVERRFTATGARAILHELLDF